MIKKLIIYYVEYLEELASNFLIDNEVYYLIFNEYSFFNWDCDELKKIKFTKKDNELVCKIVTNSKKVKEFLEKKLEYDEGILMIWCYNKFKLGGKLKND